jgi:hypothetical protein
MLERAFDAIDCWFKLVECNCANLRVLKVI